MIQYLSKLVEKTPIVVSTVCSSLMMGLITVALAGGPPPGTTKPPTQPSTKEPAEVEENTEPTRRQPPASQPSSGQGKPVEAEPEISEPPRRQPPNVGNPANQQQDINQTPQFPEPAGRVTPVEGLITLRLINQTDAVIRYQVIGGRHRTLGERSVVEIYELPIPLTLTYQRPDGGLLLVTPRGISSRVLEVRFNSTENFDLDTKSLNITGKGGVFLN